MATQVKLGSNQEKIMQALKEKPMTYEELRQATGIRLEFHSAFDGLKRRGRITQTVSGKYRSDLSPVEPETELFAHIDKQNKQMSELTWTNLDLQGEVETYKHLVNMFKALLSDKGIPLPIWAQEPKKKGT